MLVDRELTLGSINIHFCPVLDIMMDVTLKRRQEKYFGDTRHAHKSVIVKVLVLDTVLDTGFILN